MTRFGDLPDAAAARWGDREALVFRDRRYTFRRIAAEVDRVAGGLVAAGVRPGEKVALWLVNRPEWIFAMFALAKIGAVHVPMLAHPGVRQVAVVGYPDARLSEVPVAFVQRAPGAEVTPAELVGFCRGRIATFKAPRHVFLVDEFPSTWSGKVQKARLRDEARERLG